MHTHTEYLILFLLYLTRVYTIYHISLLNKFHSDPHFLYLIVNKYYAIYSQMPRTIEISFTPVI